jgi:hypothetical protein
VKRLALSVFLCAVSLAFSAFVSADTLTLPAATSLPVGAAASPFFSDVRVFNTSYTSAVSVMAVYRCFLGACPGAAPQVTFTLGPRESRPFDDMISSAFNAPSSAGAVEFTSTGDSVRVTSRLFSPVAGGGTNGMFVPGMKASDAHAPSVLTGLSNGLFRTNIGVYNGNDAGVSATIKLFNGAVLLGTQTVTLGPRSGMQINRIFNPVGRGALVTTNAYAVVTADNPSVALFTYAAVIDNATADSSFISGEPDEPGPSGPQATATPPPTATPTQLAVTPTRTPTSTPSTPPTATPTQLAATPTRTPPSAPSTTVVDLVATQFQWNFNNSGASFTMHVGQTYELRIRSGDVTHGFGGIPALGLSSATLDFGAAPVIRTITPTSAQIGSHSLACSIFCGSGHPFFGSIQVSP